MKGVVEIQSVMTPCPHSVRLDQGLKVAREMLHTLKIHHLPVVHQGRLVGVITDRDVKFASGWSRDDKEEFTVRDVYTSEPYVVEPTTALDVALHKMIQEQYGCVLVASGGDKLLGIFTTTDACRCLIDYLTASKQ